MPDIEVNGQTVHWRESGTGEAVVLLHPMLGHGGSFRGVAEGLPEFRCIMPDLPGHGHSGYERGTQAIQQQAVDGIAAIVESLEGPVHLVGHSFGGTVATRLAAADTARFASLTLIEPVWFGFLKDAQHEGYETEALANAPFIAAMEAGDHAKATAHFMRRWGGPVPFEMLPAQMQSYIAARIDLIAESAVSVGMMSGPRMHLSDIETLPEKLLLIDGAESPKVIHDILDLMQARFDQARRLSIPKAGHMAPMTHPSAVAEAIRALIQE